MPCKSEESFQYLMHNFYCIVAQGCIIGATHFLLYISDLPDDVICKIVIYADTSIYETL